MGLVDRDDSDISLYARALFCGEATWPFLPPQFCNEAQENTPFPVWPVVGLGLPGGMARRQIKNFLNDFIFLYKWPYWPYVYIT